MTPQFPHLFSPLKLRSKTLKNRFVFVPHETHLAKNRLPSEGHVYYHRERAKGGVGMTIIEACSIHPTGGLSHMNYTDDIIPWYQKLAKAVHEYDTVILSQFGHLGRKTMGKMKSLPEENLPVVAPSAIPALSVDFPWVMPHELDIDEIHELIGCYGQAARRSREGGLDGSEIGAHMGSLMTQFLSPHANKRKDQYGGNSLKDRMKFLLEVIDIVRKNLGEDLILGVRLGEEFIDYSLSFEDIKQIAPLVEATGKVDYISISEGCSYEWKSASIRAPIFYYPPGSFTYLAAGVKEKISLPVITAGRINSPQLAEQILSDGQADMIGICRGLVCDPYFPVKAQEGKPDDIRACLACSEGCHGHTLIGRTIGCIQNPVAGREQQWSALPPLKKKKKVVVIGGGPAGLEAARVAAERGHDVTIFERKDKLGGQVELAAKAPLREDFVEIIRYLTLQIKRFGIKTRLGTEATLQTVLEMNPDAVIVATGSSPFIPPIPGVENKNVVTAWDVMGEQCKCGESVAVIDTQGMNIGAFTADFLSERGKKVKIVTQLHDVGTEINKHVWRILSERLLGKGVEILPFTMVKEIRENSLLVHHTITNAESTLDNLDTIVLAVGAAANDSLYRSLKGKVKELYAIGDCVAPRDVEAAIYEGHKVGRTL